MSLMARRRTLIEPPTSTCNRYWKGIILKIKAVPIYRERLMRGTSWCRRPRLWILIIPARRRPASTQSSRWDRCRCKTLLWKAALWRMNKTKAGKGATTPKIIAILIRRITDWAQGVQKTESKSKGNQRIFWSLSMSASAPPSLRIRLLNYRIFLKYKMAGITDVIESEIASHLSRWYQKSTIINNLKI